MGASDAGAHLDMLDTFAFTTQLLGRGVREMKLISLEEAVHQLTEVPARFYGLRAGLDDLHSATMRADDHQLQQPLRVSVMERAGAPGVQPAVEGSGFGFRTLQRSDAAAVSQAFQCRLRRPD